MGKSSIFTKISNVIDTLFHEDQFEESKRLSRHCKKKCCCKKHHHHPKSETYHSIEKTKERKHHSHKEKQSIIPEIPSPKKTVYTMKHHNPMPTCSSCHTSTPLHTIQQNHYHDQHHHYEEHHDHHHDHNHHEEHHNHNHHEEHHNHNHHEEHHNHNHHEEYHHSQNVNDHYHKEEEIDDEEYRRFYYQMLPQMNIQKTVRPSIEYEVDHAIHYAENE